LGGNMRQEQRCSIRGLLVGSQWQIVLQDVCKCTQQDPTRPVCCAPPTHPIPCFPHPHPCSPRSHLARRG
jgi:hypothetical protein